MLVMTFIFQLIRAAWRRDGQALGQAVTGTVSASLFAMTAITFTGVALVIVDALSRGLFQIANSSMDDAVRRLVKVSMITVTTPLGWAIPALVALGCAAGAILYWGAMVLRKVTILVLVVLAPFAAAGGAWEPTRDWRRKWIEATATVVFSKLIMTIIMLVGVSALGQSDTKDGIQALSDIIAGLVVMALVRLSPMAIYKFVHWAGDGQAHDLHRSTATGLQVGAATAQKGARMAATAGAGGAGGAAMGGAAPQGPAQVPGQDAPAGGSGGNSGSGEGSSSSQNTFRFPGTSSGGDAVGKALITRRAQSGGDQGQPLISRALASGQSSGGGASDGTPAKPTSAVAAAGGGGGAVPQVVFSAARGARGAAQAPAGPPASAAGPATPSVAATGPASAPSSPVGPSTPPTS